MKILLLSVSLSLLSIPTSVSAAASLPSLPADSAPKDRLDRSQLLWDAWPAERFVHEPAPCLRPAELVADLERLRQRFSNSLTIEVIGSSAQNRPIHLLTLGQGPRKVLLWSQMHGDEPSATPALLDLTAYLLSHRDEEPWVARVLEELTLLVVPMLNPDGAEVYQRRNAQAIDVNRDALNLATPEGRILKTLRDEQNPILGFNLHDQNRRRTAGDTGVPASNALLAVAGDAANTLTPGRLLAKRICSTIALALAPHRPGGMARYDETFSPRSFGDNITAWGTPVVLIESGSVLAGTPFDDLTRLNFVALLVALDHLASGAVEAIDPTIYEALPDNNLGPWTDVIVRGGHLWAPGQDTVYRADLAFDRLRSDQEVAGCRPPTAPRSVVTEVGDAREMVAGEVVDATGRILTPPLTAVLDGWSGRDWLADAATRSLLAGAGIGHLQWTLKPRDRPRAVAWLDRHRADDPGFWPRIELVLDSRPLSWLALRGNPPSTDSRSASDSISTDRTLWDRLQPLVTDKSAKRAAGDDALWARALGDRLHPGAAATFLLLSPVSTDDASLGGLFDYSLDGFWSEGVQVP